MGSDPRQDRTVEVGLVLRDVDLRAYRRPPGRADGDRRRRGPRPRDRRRPRLVRRRQGADGLVQATALLSSHPTLPVQTGVYLLALRHPAVVARQLSTISDIAPGRLTFGVGVGGDDPRELELCGVEPKTRGARTSEALALLREFLTGEEVTFAGRFFNVEGAAIRPAPRPVAHDPRGRPLRRRARGAPGASATAGSRCGSHRGATPRASGSCRRPPRGRAVPTSPGSTRCSCGPGSIARTSARWRACARSWSAPTAWSSSASRATARAGARRTSRPELEPFLRAGCRRFNLVFEADGLDAAAAAAAELKDLLSNAADWTPRRQEVTLENIRGEQPHVDTGLPTRS